MCYLNVDDVGVVKEKLRDTIESNFELNLGILILKCNIWGMMRV